MICWDITKLVCLVTAMTLGDAADWAYDDTIKDGATGSEVVEAVCARLRATQVVWTGDDYQLCRRLAYVESNDGQDSKTFRSGYYGGIWQVDHGKFFVSMQSQTHFGAIYSNLGIYWPYVAWTDLRKPLYSALAAFLYLNQSNINAIPSTVEGQAAEWTNYYRLGSDSNDYINKVNALNRDYRCTSANTDVLFMTNLPNQQLVSLKKTFVQNTVDGVTNSTILDRFGFMYFNTSSSYPNQSTLSIELGTRSTDDFKNETLSDLDILAPLGSSTFQWNENALSNFFNDMINIGFESSSPSTAKVAVLLLDNTVSTSNGNLLSAYTTETYFANVSLIAVGNSFISCITSTNCFQYGTDVNYFIYVTKQICDAPVIVSSQQDVQIRLPSNGAQNIKIMVPAEGASVQVNSTSGAVTFYCITSVIGTGFYSTPTYAQTTPYPNAKYYQTRVDVSDGQSGTLDVGTDTRYEGMNNDFILCRITTISTSGATANIGVTDNAASYRVSALTLFSKELSSNSDIRCFIEIPRSTNYVYIQMSMQSGSGTATLYVSGSVLPTDTLYDNKTQAQYGKTGFIYVDTTQLTGSPAFVFGYITGDQSTTANVTLKVVTPNQGVCKHQPCQNGGTCVALSDTSYQCYCVSSYSGDSCQTNGASSLKIVHIQLLSLMLTKFL